MKIEVNDKMAKEVEAMLARQGESPDVEGYVQRTLAKRLLFETITEVRCTNEEVPLDEIAADIEEAVRETRKQRRMKGPHADRS